MLLHFSSNTIDEFFNSHKKALFIPLTVFLWICPLCLSARILYILIKDIFNKCMILIHLFFLFFYLFICLPRFLYHFAPYIAIFFNILHFFYYFF